MCCCVTVLASHNRQLVYMALVPFSVAGAGASQDLEQRLMQVGPYSLLLRQRPEASGNTGHLKAGAVKQRPIGHTQVKVTQNGR